MKQELSSPVVFPCVVSLLDSIVRLLLIDVYYVIISLSRAYTKSISNEVCTLVYMYVCMYIHFLGVGL